MEEDSQFSNWVLVNEIDCAEEAISLNPSVTSIPTTPDSDQESDGSISIIGDHPTDSYSEEELEISKKNDIATKLMPIFRIDTEYESEINERKIKDQTIDSVTDLENCRVEDQNQEMSISHLTISSEDDGSSISEPVSKQWTFADNKSKLELDTPKKTFFLDCSQEPILEVSSNDTDADTESNASLPECQTIVKKEETPFTNISNRDASRERDVYINRISIGFIISMLILTSSHLIQQYLDYSEDVILSPSPSNSFLDSIADNEKARPILNFCIAKQKAKGSEYSEHAVEKCVIKKLRKKNREDAVKKTEIYLQMKERILELREKELADKEKEILKKWKKRMYLSEDIPDSYGKQYQQQPKKDKTSKESNKKYNKDKSREIQKDTLLEIDENIKDKIKTFRKKDSWIFEKAKAATDWNHKMPSNNDLQGNKKPKKDIKEKEETLKQVKNKVKEFHKGKSIRNHKGLKGDNKEEEWYIKYNPLKNTIELINITTLPKQDSILIRNGNKTINGQWYFSLYGSARSNIRHKERAAEWYFRRGNFREHKRDKAKWYFDYMSARDDTRYFY